MSNANEPAFASPGTPYFNQETGVPLDPCAGYGWMIEPRAGLTKRELFAAMAMQGMLASETEASNYGHIGFLAESAVKRADALLAELAK